MLSVEIVPPTRLLFQYTKALTKSEKLRTFIAPNMTDIITFLDKNGKSVVYMGGEIQGIYRYLEVIGATTTLTTSGQRSHHFGPSYSSNNDAENLQPIIVALLTFWLDLQFSMSHFQYYIIRFPQVLYWFLKGYIWTSSTLWICLPSSLFLDITLLDLQQSWISSPRNCQDESLQR